MKYEYNDDKYTQAVDALAEQLVAMVIEDGEIGYDDEDYKIGIADHANVAAQDVADVAEKLIKEL